LLGKVTGGVAATLMSILHNARLLNGISLVDLNFDHCGRLLITSDGRPGSQQGRMILRMNSEPMFTAGGVASSGLSKPVKIRLAVVVGMIVFAIVIGFLARQGQYVTPSATI
jgi:hypothetical protein